MKKANWKMILVLINTALTGCISPGGAGGGAGGGPGGGSASSGNSSQQGTEKECSKMNQGSPDFSCDCSHVDVDLPFHYSINSDQLVLHAEGGSLHGMISPWGAHTEPFTGHFGGNGKADWGALYASSYADMTELTPSNRNGICEKGETCGVHRSKIESKQFKYIAPANRFVITAVYAGKTKNYRNEFEGKMSYQVYGWVCNYRYTFPYMKQIGPKLREKMIAAGYEDPHSINSSGNLIKGNPIVLDKGDEIGLLQVRAEAVPNHPDYFRGWGGTGLVPYSALEFTLDNLSLTDGYDTGIYPLLPKQLQESLLAVLYAEGKKGENSLKFGTRFHEKWLWSAEMVLNASEPMRYRDYSSLFSWLGGWVERPKNENCQGRKDKECDENFAIFKIHKDSPFYDSRLYDSAAVSYLINRGGGSGLDSGEILSPSQPDPISGTIVIKWRNNGSGKGNGYQRIAYSVEPQNKHLKVRWGVAKPTLSTLEEVAIPQKSEVCDGETLVCYDHEPRF